MTTFQYTIYHKRKKKKKSALENAFKDLIKKVELYEKQYEVTLKLYKSEWDKELEELNKKFTIDEKHCLILYDKAYAEKEREEDEFRDFYAGSVSGLETLRCEYYEEKTNIKKRYLDFFDMYSKSLLIALYSLTESTLKEICDIASEDSEQKIKYEHLNSHQGYLNKSLTYLKLVIQIPIDPIKDLESKLQKIRFIRNKIVHSESKFSKKAKNAQEEISEIVKKSKGSLDVKQGKNFVILIIKKPNFILDYFKLIREFFEELIWLIDAKQEKKVLRKGLEYWFKILDENIFITNINSERNGRGKRKITFDLSSRKKNIPKFKCTISIVRAARQSLEILNQVPDNKPISEFSDLVKKVEVFIFDYVFELFNMSKKSIKINVMMFVK